MFVGRIFIAVSAALLTLPALATQHIVDIVWDGSGRFAQSARVQPGKFVEVCGALKVGDTVRWAFDAGAPLDFNVHYHVGKAAEFPAKLNQVAAAEDVLRVSVKETYCWMWTNTSKEEVRLGVTLQR
jgi:hypothetical protein